MEPKRIWSSSEEFESVWEEQFPSGEKPADVSADIILRDILLDALRQI